MSDFTTISAGRRDVDSPVDEDLIDDIIENTEHNEEHAMRVGTYAVGVRRAWACGRMGATTSTPWTFTTSAGGDGSTTVTVLYSTDAEDGDPNFLTGETPIVAFSLEENDDASSVPWLSTGFNMPIAWIGHGTNIDTGFTIEIGVENGQGSIDYEGFVNWTATALVDTDE